MALPELLRVLEDETAAEVRAIGAAATAEAAQVEAEAVDRRNAQIASATAGCAADCRAAGDAELAAVTRAARSEVLAARAAMLDRIHAAVLDELPGLVAGDPQLGRALVAAALACVGDEHGTLRCTPALAELARAAAPPAIRVEAEPALTTGVVVELATGTRVDATLTTLLDRAWPTLACEAVNQERAR